MDELGRLESVSAFERWSPEAAESLNDLLRALRRKRGFGLFFVQCSPAMGQRVIEAIRERLPQKRVAEFELDRESETLYGEMVERYEAEQFEIACVTGMEKSLYQYEDTKRLAGWSSKEIYNYSWKGVPALLSHLNRQRESFEKNLSISLVFFISNFVVDYLIQRAPDFFDWRSGFFKFVEYPNELSQYTELLTYEEYAKLAPERRIEIALEIKAKILQSNALEFAQQSNLLLEQGHIFKAGKDMERSLECYERSIKLNPDSETAWRAKFDLLHDLAKYDEIIKDCELAISTDAEHVIAWKEKGFALYNLGKYQESLKSLNYALGLNPNDHEIWAGRGDVYRENDRLEESLLNYDKAIEIEPGGYYPIWICRAGLLESLGRYREAFGSYILYFYYQFKTEGKVDFLRLAFHAFRIPVLSIVKPSIYFKITNFVLERIVVTYTYHSLLSILDPKESMHLNNKAYLLISRYSYGSENVFGKPLLIRISDALNEAKGNREDFIQHCEKSRKILSNALKIDPYSILSWANLSFPNYYLKQYQIALQSCDKAIELNVNNEENINEVIYSNRGHIHLELGHPSTALQDFTTALSIDPQLSEAWNGKGTALYKLERYSEAAECFTQALRLEHPLAQTNLTLTQAKL